MVIRTQPDHISAQPILIMPNRSQDHLIPTCRNELRLVVAGPSKADHATPELTRVEKSRPRPTRPKLTPTCLATPKRGRTHSNSADHNLTYQALPQSAKANQDEADQNLTNLNL